MTKRKFLTFLFSVFFFVVIYGLFSFPVFAAPQLELDYPGLPAGIPKVPDFIAWIFKFALGASGALAFGVLVFGGIKYITSAGNASAQGDAKQWIQGALLGLLLLLGSVLILGTINPKLTTFGVPPEPDFKLGSANVIFDAATYRQCMVTNAPSICGCSLQKSVEGLGKDLSCSYRDNATGSIIRYCDSTNGVCVKTQNTEKVGGFLLHFQNIYCCSGFASVEGM